MFSQVSVCPRGVSSPLHAGIHLPGQTPPSGQTPLGRHPVGQTPPQAGTPLNRLPLGRHPPGRHPLAVHAGIWSTSRQYASHWKPFLLAPAKFAKVMFLHVSVCPRGGLLWGVPAPGEVGLLPGGRGVPPLEGCLLPGGCLLGGGSAPRGVPAPGGSAPGGVCSGGGGCGDPP